MKGHVQSAFQLIFNKLFKYILQGKNTEQVCGKNNITYHSYCHMLKDSCNTGFNIDTKHTGRCSSWYIFFLLFDGGSAHISNGSF